MFVCQKLFNGFCETWQEIEPVLATSTPAISANSSSLEFSEIFQAQALGFFVAGSVFIAAWVAKTIRSMLLEL